MLCYLLTGALVGLVVVCVLDDIHIYDMFFCYLLTGALVGLVVACVLGAIVLLMLIGVCFFKR